MTDHSETDRIPSLLDPESRGGDVAGGGFDFQGSVMMSYVPAWLAHEGFEEMTWESMGDVEAKYFVPGRPHVRELIEVKNHRILPSEFWEEVRRFRDLERGSPDTYRRFVLIGKELGEHVKRLKDVLERVRGPRSFYEGTPIEEASFARYAETIVAMGRSREEARFLFERVEIRDNLTTDEAQWRAIFGERLTSHFPEYEDLPGWVLRDIYEGLGSLLRSRRNRSIFRREIEQRIRERVPEARRPPVRPVGVRTLTGNEEDDRSGICPIRLDWKDFFGGDDRRYPQPVEWDERLVGELRQTKDWILRHRGTRRVRLTGTRRLSVSLAIGAVFSAVAGFAVEMEYRGGDMWSTDAHPGHGTPGYSLASGGELARSERLAVSVGVLRDISGEVEQALEHLGLAEIPMLHLKGDKPVVSAEHANVAAAAIKDHIRDGLSVTGSEHVDFFFAGPAPLALFLGHRLNATAQVRCYERVAPGRYMPTCGLS